MALDDCVAGTLSSLRGPWLADDPRAVFRRADPVAEVDDPPDRADEPFAVLEPLPSDGAAERTGSDANEPCRAADGADGATDLGAPDARGGDCGAAGYVREVRAAEGGDALLAVVRAPPMEAEDADDERARDEEEPAAARCREDVDGTRPLGAT